jgi:protein involved in sex pheromone biosynthesis
MLLTETGAGFQHSKMAALAHLVVLRGCGRGFQSGVPKRVDRNSGGSNGREGALAQLSKFDANYFSSGLAFVEPKAGDSGNEVQARALF